MRVVKRVAAALIAVIIALSAGAIGFADETRDTYYSTSITLEVGEEISISKLSVLPEGYTGATYMDYLYNALSDSNSKKIVSAQNGVIKALREGTAYIYIENYDTGERIGAVSVNVVPRQADNFFELVRFTFEAMGRGALKTLEGTAAAILSVAFGISTPIIMTILGIGSIFI